MKSIIDIDVNDAAFKRFTDLYDKYQNALGKQAEMWKKAGTSQATISSHFQKMTSQLLAQNAAQQGASNATKQQLTSATSLSRLWTQMSSSTASVAKNIASATASLLRWGVLLEGVSGLLGVGGLWGITRMASNVSDQRTSARGRGVTIGEQSAFRNFERYGLDSSFLDTISGIKGDPRKAWSLSTFGVSNDMSVGDTTVAMLRAMRGRAQSTPDSQLGLLDAQTGMNLGVTGWRALGSGTDAEFNKTLNAYSKDASALNVNDKTAQSWQDFTRQMQRAGQQIENVFVNGLVRLEGPLSRLSGAFVGLVKTIMGSDGMRDGIDILAKWINEFSKSIESGEFQKSVKTFIDGVAGLADTVKQFARSPGDVAGTWASNSFNAGSIPRKLIDMARFKGTIYENADPIMFGGAGDNPAASWLPSAHSKSMDEQLNLPEGTLRKLAGTDPRIFGGADNSYDTKMQGIYDELYRLERKNRSWLDTNDNAATQKALMQYGSAHALKIVINTPAGSDVNASVNALAQ